MQDQLVQQQEGPDPSLSSSSHSQGAPSRGENPLEASPLPREKQGAGTAKAQGLSLKLGTPSDSSMTPGPFFPLMALTPSTSVASFLPGTQGLQPALLPPGGASPRTIMAPPPAAHTQQELDQEDVAREVETITEAIQRLRVQGLACVLLGSGQIVLYDPPMGNCQTTLGSLVSHEATDCILVVQPGPRRIHASSGTCAGPP